MIFHQLPSRPISTRNNCINMTPSRSKDTRIDCHRDHLLAAKSFDNHKKRLHIHKLSRLKSARIDCRSDPFAGCQVVRRSTERGGNRTVVPSTTCHSAVQFSKARYTDKGGNRTVVHTMADNCKLDNSDDQPKGAETRP